MICAGNPVIDLLVLLCYALQYTVSPDLLPVAAEVVHVPS